MTYKNPEPPDEVLRLFDAQGNEVEPRSRQWIWDHPEYETFHAIGAVWVVNRSGKILCSKRSENLKGSPGKWQPRFGGKVPVGSTCRETAIRELEEEVGIKPDLEKMVPIEETSRRAMYLYPFDGASDDLRFPDGEITAVRWQSIDEYREEERMHPEDWCCNLKPEHEIAIRQWLAKRV